MVSRRKVASSSAFPFASSDALWNSVAQGDADRIRALLDLGLSPVARLAGRYRKGNAESVSLWLLACEAPSDAGLVLMWDRMNDEERAIAMASKNGKSLPCLEVAMASGSAAVIERLVRFNDGLPARQKSHWNGWALLFTHLMQGTNGADRVERQALGATPGQRANDAALVRTLDRLGLLPAPAAPETLFRRGNPGAYECLIEAMRAGAQGCVDVLLERPMPWTPIQLNDTMPWGWALFTCPHPLLVLQSLQAHRITPDMTTGSDPETWTSFVRNFVSEPFRTPALAGVAAPDLLEHDPGCRVLLERQALRQEVDRQDTSPEPRARPRL